MYTVTTSMETVSSAGSANSDLSHHHKKMLHGKRANGQGKHSPSVDSPAYDACVPSLFTEILLAKVDLMTWGTWGIEIFEPVHKMGG